MKALIEKLPKLKNVIKKMIRSSRQPQPQPMMMWRSIVCAFSALLAVFCLTYFQRSLAGQGFQFVKIDLPFSQLPSLIPFDIPREQAGEVVTQNYIFFPIGDPNDKRYQSTRAFNTSRNLDSLFQGYKTYLQNNGWTIDATLVQPNIYVISASKGGGGFNGGQSFQVDLQANTITGQKSVKFDLSTTTACVQPPPGLVSWWPGEGNANDVQGKNSGILRNGATFASGVVGQAFSFDGIDDYINVPDSASLDALNTAITVEGWINPQTPTAPPFPGLGLGVGTIFARRDPGISEGFRVDLLADGRVSLVVRTTTSPTVQGSILTTVNPVIVFNGQWKHFAATADTATGQIKLYLNGQNAPLTATFGPATISGRLFNVDQLFIGRRSPTEMEGEALAAHYKGLVDELSLYNRELSASEVRSIFEAANSGKCKVSAPAISSVNPAIPICNSQDQNVTVLGSGFQLGLTVDVTYPGGATTLSGAQINNLTATSFVASIKLAGTGAWSLRAKNSDGGQSNKFDFQVQSGPAPTISPNSLQNQTVSSEDKLVTVSGTNFKQSLTVSVTYPGGSTTLSGAQQILGVTPNSFTMRIKFGSPGDWSIRVNNPDCSQSTVFSFKLTNPSCVQPPSGLIGWWAGDGNANDIRGGNNGLLQGGAAFAPGKVGQAFSFGGTGEVRIANTPALNVQTFTIDAWVYPTLLDGTIEMIVNKEDPNQLPIQYEIGIRGPDNSIGVGTIPQGNLAFHIGGISGLPDDYANWVNGGGAVPSNSWSYVALTFDGNTAKVYINGNLTRIIAGLSGNVNSTSGPFKIGSRSDSIVNNTHPKDRFNGLIDEVELFNRALSAAEIQAIFNAGSAGKCKVGSASCAQPPSGAVAWWPGESNANDIQGGNNGSLQNGGTFAAGFVNQAFNFNGFGDSVPGGFVSIPDSANLRPSALTFEGWFFLRRQPTGAPISGGNEFVLASKYDGQYHGWVLRVGNDLKPVFSVHRNSNPGGLAHAVSSVPLQLNTWVHIAGSYDGSTTKVYVRGSQTGSQPMTGGYTPANVPMKIGAASWYTGGFTDGLADEVSVYNRALTNAEIQSIFASGSAGKCKGTTPPCTAPTVSLINPANPIVGSAEQQVTVTGTNFKPGLTVTVAYPGGSKTLSGAQILQPVASNSFKVSINFDVPGDWSIRVNNSDCSQVAPFPFKVGTVSCAPIITKQPYAFLSNRGTAIQVEFKGSGTSPFSFQWYLGRGKDPDHPIPDESQPIPTAHSSQYLPSPKPVPTSYWVRISNNCGSVDSNSVVAKGTLKTDLVDPVCDINACSGALISRNFRGNKVSILSDPDRLAAATLTRIGAVTDGVTMLLIRTEVDSDSEVTFSLDTLYEDKGLLMPLDGSAIGRSFKVKPLKTRDNRRFAFVLYRAPVDFPASGDSITLSVSSPSLEGRREIKLARPPVVLVHGVWSDGDAWKGLDNYLQERSYRAFRVDYGTINSAPSFDPKEDNLPVVTLRFKVKQALNTLRSDGYAAAQVDVVGHSLGGLVARSRVASLFVPYKRLENYYRGDFHKIITIGTPHLGSPLASFLLLHRCDGVYKRKDGSVVGNLESLFRDGLNKPLGPALYGFQTASSMIRNIGATEVPSHAMLGVEPGEPGSEAEKTLNIIIKPLSLGLRADDILVKEEAHDTLVTLLSQQGGLPSKATSRIAQVVHADLDRFGAFGKIGTGCNTCVEDVGETASDMVWLRVLSLLQTATNSDKFAYFPPFEPVGTEIKPGVCKLMPNKNLVSSRSVAGLRSNSANSSQLSINLTPSEGATVHTGDVVPLSFTIQSGNSTKGAIFSIGGSFFNVEGTGPYSASFQITSTKAGKIEIVAFTYGDGPDNYLASTFVLLQPKAPLVSIATSPNSIQLDKVGDIEQIAVTGQFADGSKMDLTSGDAGTVYSTQSGTNTVVSVNSIGLVEAKGTGQETIVITNAGKKITVPVTVITGNPAPIIIDLNPNSVLAKGKAFTLTVDGSNFLDSSVIYWNGSPRLTIFVSSTKLMAEILDTDISMPGIANLIVFNPLPGGGTALGQVTVADCISPSVSAQPISKLVSMGSIASFAAAASGNPTPTVQWQVAPNGSSIFSDIPGATSTILSFMANVADNGKKYRAVFTNACGMATSDAATLTLVATPLLISEFRFSGPGGSGDWFVELYNNTDALLSTAGRQLGIINAAGTTSFVVNLPANGVVPARGNYLIAGPNYSLLGLAVPDLQVTALPFTGIGGVGVFNGAINNPANRLDSVAYNSVPVNALFAYFREGTALPSLGNTMAEHSWVRKLVEGLPQDTNNNQADFVLLSLAGSAINGVAAVLGVPGPQSLTSPVQRNDKVPSLMLDPNASSSSPPNRERNTTPVPNGAQGTLTLRRKFTNNTGAPIKKLRFRVVGITNSSTGSEAELRVLSSVDVMINGQLVRGVTLEQPPAQPNGGGLNSTLAVGSVTLANPLPTGASINVQFLLGVQRGGGFRFFVNVEALP